MSDLRGFAMWERHAVRPVLYRPMPRLSKLYFRAVWRLPAHLSDMPILLFLRGRVLRRGPMLDLYDLRCM